MTDEELNDISGGKWDMNAIDNDYLIRAILGIHGVSEYTRPHSLHAALKQGMVPKHLITSAWDIVDNLPMPKPGPPLADPSWQHNENPWQSNALRDWEDMT
jgi:hypothetical protein